MLGWCGAKLRRLFTFDAAPLSDSPKITILGESDMHSLTFLKSPSNIGAEVTVASIEQQLEVEAYGGTRLVADTFFSTYSAETFNLVALPAVKTNTQVSGELAISRGPGTSFDFALCLVEQVFGEPVARDIGELMVLIPEIA